MKITEESQLCTANQTPGPGGSLVHPLPTTGRVSLGGRITQGRQAGITLKGLHRVVVCVIVVVRLPRVAPIRKYVAFYSQCIRRIANKDRARHFFTE